MVLSMLRSFGKIGPQIDQIWAWLSRGHRWSPGVRNPLKSSVTGPSLLVNCYLEIKFHKIIRVNPPPPFNVTIAFAKSNFWFGAISVLKFSIQVLAPRTPLEYICCNLMASYQPITSKMEPKISILGKIGAIQVPKFTFLAPITAPKSALIV